MLRNRRKPVIALARHALRYLLGIVALVQASGTVAADGSSIDNGLSSRCLQILTSALVGEEFWPAMHAAEGLTIAGHAAEVQAAFVPRLAKEQDDRRRCGLARELVRSGARNKTAEILGVLAKPDSYGHTHAAESLYKIGEIGDGRLLHRAMAAESNVPLRIMAAAALARQGSPDALQFLRDQLSAVDRQAKQLAVWAFARLGDNSDTPALLGILREDSDPITRGNAAAALAMRGDESGREALIADLDDANPEIRSYAAEIAGHSRATILVSRLVQLLDDPNLDVRVRSAGALLEMCRGGNTYRNNGQRVLRNAPTACRRNSAAAAPPQVAIHYRRRAPHLSHGICRTSGQVSRHDGKPD
jgi:sialidase-1